MGQPAGDDHTLIVSIVLVEADQGGEQCEAKLLECRMVGVGAALRVGVAEKDARIAEHMAAGAGVGRAVVRNRNGAGLPVPSSFDGLFDDDVNLTSEAGGAGIGVNVAEELPSVLRRRTSTSLR